ncbi:hypothetical protein [Actinokineospora iranica]|uniref:Mce-associated membrane protein n=1 Tax=Actinokineospora iranica TaxID=1271860 RepID=A0A1G6V0U3_9PSEU|nr:hypothetical protein [Actinokineospora iranica]SDD46495.1 Mce-associated membrane protein [Actinokineospora iranica]
MPTPPPRRRPAVQPTRRPKVAGLRKPTGTPEPTAPTIDDNPTDQAGVDKTAAGKSGAGKTTGSGSTAKTGQADTAEKPAKVPPRPGLAAAAPEIPAPPRLTPRPTPRPSPRPKQAATAGVLGADATATVPDTAVGAKQDAGKQEDGAGSRPAGKRRAQGSAVPEYMSTVERGSGGRRRAAEAEPTAAETAARARSRGFNLAIALGVLALVLAGAAFWFKGEADSLTAGADARNRAVIDPAATSEITGKLRGAVESALSYNHTDLEATAKAVRESLAGKAVCEYDKLFGQLKDLAPQQKLVLTTKVREMGVQRLEGDQADLLVFVDQTTTRTDQDQTSASGAQFGIRAERQDGVWKITEFDMLNQPLPAGNDPATC